MMRCIQKVGFNLQIDLLLSKYYGTRLTIYLLYVPVFLTLMTLSHPCILIVLFLHKNSSCQCSSCTWHRLVAFAVNFPYNQTGPLQPVCFKLILGWQYIQYQASRLPLSVSVSDLLFCRSCHSCIMLLLHLLLIHYYLFIFIVYIYYIYQNILIFINILI